MKSTDYTCPRCDVLLQAVICEGIEVDKCMKCKGIYLDPDEIHAFEKGPLVKAEHLIEERKAWDQRASNGYMKCSACQGRLCEHVYSYLRAVKIDTCQDCFGSWLDPGELDLILEVDEEMLDDYPENALESVLRRLKRLMIRKGSDEPAKK